LQGGRELSRKDVFCLTSLMKWLLLAFSEEPLWLVFSTTQLGTIQLDGSSFGKAKQLVARERMIVTFQRKGFAFPTQTRDSNKKTNM
jgi:hypothetical protein